VRIYLLLVFIFAAGCASTQDKANPWKVIRLEGYTLAVDSSLNLLRVDTIPGNGNVLIFERTVGNIMVDAGFIERLWLQPVKTGRQMRIEANSLAFYELVCRCPLAGMHRIIDGDISWSNNDGFSAMSGYIETKDKRVEF